RISAGSRTIGNLQSPLSTIQSFWRMSGLLKLSFVIVAIMTSTFVGFASDEISLVSIKPLKKYIESLTVDSLGGQKADVNIVIPPHSNWAQITVELTTSDTVQQNDWKVELTPSFEPSFYWAPHLTPTDDHMIAQHVFRAPALIMANGSQQITVIPDLSLLNNYQGPDWDMGLNAIENKLTLGMSKSAVKEHILFVKEGGAKYPPGKIKFGFYILLNDNKAKLFNPWKQAI